MPRVAKSAVENDRSSHTFKPLMPADGIQYGMPDSCTFDCHPTMTQANAQIILDDWKENAQETEEWAHSVFKEAEALRTAALENGTISPSLDDIFLRANFNMHMAKSDSAAVHNPDFVSDLFRDVVIRSEEVIDGLSTGTIMGTVTDGNTTVVNVSVIAGAGGATTDAEGNYTMSVPTPGDYVITANIGGYAVYTSNIVSLAPAEVLTHDIKLNLDTDNDGAPDSNDTDDDGDGVNDTDDAFPLDPLETLDTDGDGTGDNADDDDDGDGVLDIDDEDPLDSTVGAKKAGAAPELYFFIIIILVGVCAIMGLFVMRKPPASELEDKPWDPELEEP
jgi:hypothetical protein